MIIDILLISVLNLALFIPLRILFKISGEKIRELNLEEEAP